MTATPRVPVWHGTVAGPRTYRPVSDGRVPAPLMYQPEPCGRRLPRLEPRDGALVFFLVCPGLSSTAPGWRCGRYSASEKSFQEQWPDGSWQNVGGVGFWMPQPAMSHETAAAVFESMHPGQSLTGEQWEALPANEKRRCLKVWQQAYREWRDG